MKSLRFATENKSYLILLLICSFSLMVPGCSSTNGDDGGGDPVGPIDPVGEKPESLPSFASLSIYSSSSPLNTKIPASMQVDEDSDEYIQKLITGAGSTGSLLIQLGQYSATVFVVDNDTPTTDVTLHCGDWWEMGVNTLKGVPIPEYAEPAYDLDGEDEPIRKGICAEESAQDNHMIIINRDTGCEFDFWQARQEDGNWVASWGNAIELSDDGIYDKGLSTRGSGFAFLGGMIWPDELVNGEITHALVFSYPFAKSGGPVAPATDSDGTITDAFSLPEGALVRLNPGLDLTTLGLTDAEMTIAKALQEYGMYLVDSGGETGIALYAIDPESVASNPYDGVLPDEDYPILENIPLDELQVMQLSAQDPDYQSRLDLVPNSCADFE